MYKCLALLDDAVSTASSVVVKVTAARLVVCTTISWQMIA
jgi:hypothetical protein